jgi:hypothetical protein
VLAAFSDKVTYIATYASASAMRSFAQLIEGPGNALSRLNARLERDVRHVRMEVLNWSSECEKGRFPAWRLGYLKYDLDVFGLAGLRGKRSKVELEAFEFMIPERGDAARCAQW